MKTENTITKAVALEMINSSFPSIWSREDVISLINKIEVRDTDKYFFENEADLNSFAEWLLGVNESEFFVIDDHIEVIANYEVLKSVTYEFQKRHIIPKENICNIDLEELKSRIINQVNKIQNDSNFINYESAEFEIGYRNQIELQNVDFNFDMITDIIEEQFNQLELN